MNPSRRDFLWSLGTVTAAGAALRQTSDVFWAQDPGPDLGWAPEIEERMTSTCLLCPARCGIQGRIVDDNMVGIVGNPLHPVSRGGICPRGIAGVQVQYHGERIRSPLRREGPRGSGQWREITRDEALEAIVGGLREIRDADRAHALGAVVGYCAGSMEDVWRKFLEAFGSANYIDDGYPDGTDSVMRLMHGIPRRPGYDLGNAGMILSFGASLFESWWSPLQAYAAFANPTNPDAHRPRFVQVDTRFSRTAARTQQWVGIRPGTFGTLALGIAYVMLRDELIDTEFVATRVNGFEDYTDGRGETREGFRSLVLRHYRPEEVASVTGVPIETVTALARAFASGRAGLAVCGPEVTHGPDGLLAGMAVHSLNILNGKINARGGVVFGAPPPLTPLASTAQDPVARAGIDRGPLVPSEYPFGPGEPPRQFAEAVAAASETPIDMLMLYYANPLASSTHPESWRAALARIPTVVSFSPFMDETTQHADIVLPDLLPFERWQDAPTPSSYPHAVWGVATPLVEPVTEGTHTGEALLSIARGLGGSVASSLPYEDFETLLKVRAQGLFAARRGTHFGTDFELRHHAQMEQRGWWLPDHSEFESFWEDLVRRGGWFDGFHDYTDPAGIADTASGRIELLPPALLEVIGGDDGQHDLYGPPADEEAEEHEDYPLLLNPYRISTLSSGTLSLQRWMAEQPSIFPDVHWEPWIEVSPENAQELGFSDGTMVAVVSARGRYRARLKVFHGTAPGTVGAPYGLRHEDELANPFHVLDGGVDALTGLPQLFSTHVRIENA